MGSFRLVAGNRHLHRYYNFAGAKAGARTVGLGPRILRCETAPLAVLASVMTLTGNLE